MDRHTIVLEEYISYVCLFAGSPKGAIAVNCHEDAESVFQSRYTECPKIREEKIHAIHN
jgi:hypothetical protein